MKLRTDDDIYRARLVYLGPPGYTLPFQWPYAQYGLLLILGFAFSAAGVFLTGGWKGLGVSLAAALFATVYIWRYVDADRPTRKVLRVALTDWRRIQPPPDQLPRLTARHIQWTTTTKTGGSR